jgi:hypothetical protein
LLVSQALTLFTTPVVYLYLDRLSQWFGRKPHAAKMTPGRTETGPEPHAFLPSEPKGRRPRHVRFRG